MNEPPKRIQTERFALRRLSFDDVDSLFTIFSDPEVVRYWSAPAMATRDEAVTLLRSIDDGWSSRSLYQWGVARLEDDVVIGTTTLTSFSSDGWRGEVGFALGRSAWGSGAMSEALRGLLDMAFDTLKLHRIEADVDPRNHRCLQLLERLGFVREGLLRERWHCQGEVQDSVVLGLIRADWPGKGAPSTRRTG